MPNLLKRICLNCGINIGAVEFALAARGAAVGLYKYLNMNKDQLREHTIVKFN